MLEIMENHTDKVRAAYPEGSFARLFWEEQFESIDPSSQETNSIAPFYDKMVFEPFKLSLSCVTNEWICNLTFRKDPQGLHQLLFQQAWFHE